jgi:hypothetical protein
MTTLTISENTDIDSDQYNLIILIDNVTKIRLPKKSNEFKLITIKNNTDHSVEINDYYNKQSINLASNNTTKVLLT